SGRLSLKVCTHGGDVCAGLARIDLAQRLVGVLLFGRFGRNLLRGRVHFVFCRRDRRLGCGRLLRRILDQLDRLVGLGDDEVGLEGRRGVGRGGLGRKRRFGRRFGARRRLGGSSGGRRLARRGGGSSPDPRTLLGSG